MESELEIHFGNDGFARDDIYPVSIFCHSACNLIIWKAGTDPDPKEEMDKIKVYVARVMDRVADLMHDYQKFSPLVALIDMKEPSAAWLQVLGDQDWHRGRFALQAVKSYEGKTIEEAKVRWLGAMSLDQYVPKRISAEDFSNALTRSIQEAKPPKGVESLLFSRYADNLRSSIESGQVSNFLDDWQSELARDINDSLGWSLLEVSSGDR